MYNKTLRSFSLFLFFTLLIFSCKKDRTDFESIGFSVSLVEAGYQTSWAFSNLGGFENYKIYISNQLFDPFDPLALSDVPFALIEDQAATSKFIDIGHFSKEVYFLLAIQINGRNIYSDFVKVEYPELIEIDFIGTKVISYPQNNALYFFNEQTTELAYYNYLTNAIVNQTILNENLTAAAVGDNGAGEEIIWVYNTAKVNFMDANTLEEKNSFFATASVNDIAINENGLFVLSPNFGSLPTQVYKRSNLSVTSELAQTSDLSTKGIGFLSKTNNELIELGKTEVNKYGVETGGTISTWDINAQAGVSDEQDYLAISPNSDYFVVTRQGRLYNAGMDMEAVILTITGRDYYGYQFSEDGQKLYCYGWEGEGYVDEIDLGTMQLEKNYRLPTVFPKSIFFINGEPMVLSRVEITNLDLRQMIIHPLNS